MSNGPDDAARAAFRTFSPVADRIGRTWDDLPEATRQTWASQTQPIVAAVLSALSRQAGAFDDPLEGMFERAGFIWWCRADDCLWRNVYTNGKCEACGRDRLTGTWVRR